MMMKPWTQAELWGTMKKTNLWHINPATDKVHPAVFPPELAARVVQFLLV